MNTFAIQINITATGYPTISRSVQYSVTPTASNAPVSEQAVTTSWEAVQIGELTAGSMGPCYFENLSEAETLQLALANDNSGIFASIPPSTATSRSYALIPLKTGTIYARAAANSLSFTSVCTGQ